MGWAVMSSDSDDWDVPDEGTFQKVDTDAIVAAEEAAKEQERARAKADAEAKKLANAKQAEAAKREEARKARDDEPLILVDITALDPDVHNRHDKNAVNDVDKASTWRRTIEREYQKYSNDVGMIAAGTVRGCARGVYLAALQQLRDEVPGHYWVAVFPPASS